MKFKVDYDVLRDKMFWLANVSSMLVFAGIGWFGYVSNSRELIGSALGSYFACVFPAMLHCIFTVDS